MAEKKPVIEFTNFTFQYFAQAKPTLHDINLTIYKGEKILIVGPSGSGKSTVGNCINGLIPFSYKGEIAGSLKVCGEETSQSDIFQLSKKIGTVLQDTDGQFIGLTVGEDIAFSLENDCKNQSEMQEIVDKASTLVGMNKFLNSSPHELSGGQKQRVSFAGVMVDDVDILLFDEPLANLDPKTGQTAVELIDSIHKKYNKTVIIIEHRLEDVLHCDVDRIIVMNEGLIKADMSPDKLMASGILPEFGIREPLYVTVLRYAGIPVTENLHAGRLESLAVDDVKTRLTQWSDKQPERSEKAPGKELLRAENLSFQYDLRTPYVLNGINFSVHAGEMVSIVGTNGAGKSTLAKVICGIGKHYGGELFLDGQDMRDMTIKERSQSIGYVMQNPNQMICKPMIYDEIALGLRLNGFSEENIHERIEKVLEICGLAPFAKWPISALSYGQKKRVTIASVLAMEPRIMILDEPTAGQDYRRYTEIMDFLKKLNDSGVTILLITHDMHLMLEYTQHALVFDAGTILLDSDSVHALTDQNITNKAGLKVTSLYHLAEKAGIPDRQKFVHNFIDFELRASLKTEVFRDLP